MIRVAGARGTVTTLDRPARRVVSLVPSITDALFALGAGDRVSGRSDYCVEPRGEVESIPTVGGTKNASLDAVLALDPDLVLLNQEENTEALWRGVAARGLAAHLSFPKTLADAVSLTRDLALLVGMDPDRLPVIADFARQLAEAAERRRSRVPVRVFCPIWMDPLMTVSGETFISDVLDLAGGENVFSGRARRYPLAADVAGAPAWSDARVGERDLRYPRVSLDEVVALAPEVVLLPDEPHPFSEADAEVFRALDIPAARAGRVRRVEGKALCWSSPRAGAALREVESWLHGP